MTPVRWSPEAAKGVATKGPELPRPSAVLEKLAPTQ